MTVKPVLCLSATIQEVHAPAKICYYLSQEELNQVNTSNFTKRQPSNNKISINETCVAMDNCLFHQRPKLTNCHVEKSSAKHDEFVALLVDVKNQHLGATLANNIFQHYEAQGPMTIHTLILVEIYSLLFQPCMQCLIRMVIFYILP